MVLISASTRLNVAIDIVSCGGMFQGKGYVFMLQSYSPSKLFHNNAFGYSTVIHPHHMSKPPQFSKSISLYKFPISVLALILLSFYFFIDP